MGRQGSSASRHLLVVSLLLLAACGRVGPPVAPERVSPQPVANLGAVVVDRAIELGWTFPTRRADNVRLRDLAVVHVFRTDDDGAADPKPALVAKGRVAGYTEIAAIRLAQPAPALVSGDRMTFVDRTATAPGRS
jgi:hypothetical protein